MPQVFFVNVFANASHPFVNPLFEDSTFEIIPIPEGDRYRGKWIKRYKDVLCFNSTDSLTKYLRSQYHERFVHNDPDLVHMTYGDSMNPRSALLDTVAIDDWVAFYALLTAVKHGQPVKDKRAFYIVAAFEVQQVIRELPDLKGNPARRRNFVRNRYGSEMGRRILENAHVRRWLQSPRLNDRLRLIVVGGPRSARFRNPIRLTRSSCMHYFAGRDGEPWRWGKFKTELQAMGSYLRSVRIAKPPEELIDTFRKHGNLGEPKLFSYIVAHDSGFAPCVMDGLLSLACCKPKIRSAAGTGDWIMGTTPKKRRSGRLVFLMKVDEKITFADYYRKFPKRRADNIYRPLKNRRYHQKKNRNYGRHQKKRDLSTGFVLISRDFVYFGDSAIPIPREFSHLVHGTLGHKKITDSKVIIRFLNWGRQKGWGVQGGPADTINC